MFYRFGAVTLISWRATTSRIGGGLSYWPDIFETSPAEIQAQIDGAAAAVRARGVQYTLLLGNDAEPSLRQWMSREMPTAVVTTWRGSGHFPHVADPARFAVLLAGTGGWQASVTAS